MKKLLLALAVVCATVTSGLAQAVAPAVLPAPTTVSGVPDTVAAGFTTFMKSGYATAVEVWSRGSSLNLDANATAVINKSLSDEESIAGSFVSPEIIKIVNLSSSSTLVYILGKYQRGALYMCFACYMSPSPDKWLVTSIACDTDPAKILPTNLLGGQQ